MDVHTDIVEPATPMLSCDNVRFCKTEDSGYHTFTPGSINCSELSNENIDPAGIQGSICRSRTRQRKFYKNTPEPCSDQSNFSENNENYLPIPERRGVKRPYQDDVDANEVSYGSIATPTSIIAGQIRKLKVNDSANFSGNYSISPISSEYSDATSIYNFNAYSFPSTPIKKICKSSCKLNRLKSNNKSSPLRSISNFSHPPKKFARQLDFETHSLSCEPQSHQAVTQSLKSPTVGPVLYKPNQKIDIIKLLSKTVICVPAIEKILSYMSPIDIFNFTLVSPTWRQVCEDWPEGKDKLKTYLRLSKENQENKRRSSPKVNNDIRRKLKDIHNIEHQTPKSPLNPSPPASPRSRRFKMFVRSASMDTRVQLACVRCQQPAKLTNDSSGEIWAECTRITCAYQFCKNCSCDRHPGKSCIRFDLDGPSPSKRKKQSCAAGSRKSKTNLRRLLIK